MICPLSECESLRRGKGRASGRRQDGAAAVVDADGVVSSHPIVSLVVLAIAAVLLQGCSTSLERKSPWSAQSHAFSYLNQREVPTDPEKFHRECAWLHSKMAEIELFLERSAKIENSNWWNRAWREDARLRSADLASRHNQMQCQIRPIPNTDLPDDSSDN